MKLIIGQSRRRVGFLAGLHAYQEMLFCGAWIATQNQKRHVDESGL